jgi:ADP-heptose:LPS heptosyltransferase
VIVTGGPDEVDLANDVAARAGLPSSAVHAGQGGVLTIGRLVAAADRVVCGDTGVAHLATALRTPSVVLFGPRGVPEVGRGGDQQLPPVRQRAHRAAALDRHARPWHR